MKNAIPKQIINSIEEVYWFSTIDLNEDGAVRRQQTENDYGNHNRRKTKEHATTCLKPQNLNERKFSLRLTHLDRQSRLIKRFDEFLQLLQRLSESVTAQRLISAIVAVLLSSRQNRRPKLKSFFSISISSAISERSRGMRCYFGKQSN